MQTPLREGTGGRRSKNFHQCKRVCVCVWFTAVCLSDIPKTLSVPFSLSPQHTSLAAWPNALSSYEDILGRKKYTFFLAASQMSKQSASSGGSGFAYFNVQIHLRFPPPSKKAASRRVYRDKPPEITHFVGDVCLLLGATSSTPFP